ncbi:MAG: hypothetical protein KAX09_00885 [Candidatus Heimdallarchaeota archaeon]|nr:hypothetical protein [Candidatus Heimdallarchaeota archaeon]MCK4289513.1 hypothetical protein [Candidatus Heimdallarchaeota archaeon]
MRCNRYTCSCWCKSSLLLEEKKISHSAYFFFLFFFLFRAVIFVLASYPLFQIAF